MDCTVAPGVAGSFFVTARLGDGEKYSATNNRPTRSGGVAAALECPASVIRGDPVTCTASGFSEITAWSFVSDDGRFSVDRIGVAEADVTWSGTMVLGGTVTVTGRVGNTTESKFATVVVTARNWVGRTAPTFEVTYGGQGRLPPLPRTVHALGEVRLPYDLAVASAFRLGAVGFVSEGPNEGLLYVTEIPKIITGAVVYMNEAALTSGSAFWHGQKQNNPGVVFDANQSCTRSYVASQQLKDDILAHEGLKFEDNSHTYLYRKAVNDLLGPALEPLVAPDALFGAIWDAAVGPTWEEIKKRGDETDNLRPIRPNCSFNFNYSSSK